MSAASPRLVPSALRLLAVGGIALAALASSSSQSADPVAPGPATGAPPASPMDPSLALGLWKTSFGPVKIEADETGGPSAVAGVWAYDKEGRQVVGYFQGALDGNVLRFTWHEPGPPVDLTGDGYLVFGADGRTFDGRWSTTARDNGGTWNGWRAPGTEPSPTPDGTSPAAPTDPAAPADAPPPPADDAPTIGPDGWPVPKGPGSGDAEQAPPGGPPSTI